MDDFRARAVYDRTWRTYVGLAPPLLLVGAVVFVPLGLIDALADGIHIDTENGIDLPALAGGVSQVISGLLGDVFYSGAIAALLTSDRDRPFSLVRLAGEVRYGTLIAVDILYALAVALGLLLFIAPGVIFFTWFALAAPIVELEGGRVRAALARSRMLVRGRFWRVLAVMGPIALVTDGAAGLLTSLGHDAFGDTFLSSWLVESIANILLTPFWAVAAVLITLDLLRLSGRERSD